MYVLRIGDSPTYYLRYIIQTHFFFFSFLHSISFPLGPFHSNQYFSYRWVLISWITHKCFIFMGTPAL